MARTTWYSVFVAYSVRAMACAVCEAVYQSVALDNSLALADSASDLDTVGPGQWGAPRTRSRAGLPAMEF